MNAETIAVGSEMLTPHRQDTNSLYLTDKLNELGVEVRFKSVVGDNSDDLTAAAKLAMRRSWSAALRRRSTASSRCSS